MTRTLWTSRELADEVGRSLRLEYYLLTETQAEPEQYGIEVALHRNGQTDTRQCLRLTPLPDRAAALLTQLAQQTVTPTTLEEILRDLL